MFYFLKVLKSPEVKGEAVEKMEEVEKGVVVMKMCSSDFRL
jgi:hypothetical protein